MDGRQGSPARLLVALGAAALVGSLAFRALADELDLDPIVAVLILWALLTVGFLAFSRLRSRRNTDEHSPEAGSPLIKEEDGDAASGREPFDDAEQRPPRP